MGNLPITSKLWPKTAANWLYLAEAAVLTRIMTGLMRVLQNDPSKNNDPHLTPNQKRQTLIERGFVEIVGTLGYMLCLHLGQDAVSKIYEKAWKPTLPKIQPTQQLKDILEKELHVPFNQFEDMIHNVYASQLHPQSPFHKGLISRVLYGETLNSGDTLPHANLHTLKNKLLETQQTPNIQAIRKETAVVETAIEKVFAQCHELKAFAKRNNQVAALGILSGVLSSALVGGSIIQWLNDRVVGPASQKLLSRLYGPDPGTPATRQNIVNRTTTTAFTGMPTMPGAAQPHPANFPSAIMSPPSFSTPGFAAAAPSLTLPGSATTMPNLLPTYLPNPKIQSQGQFVYGPPSPPPFGGPRL